MKLQNERLCVEIAEPGTAYRGTRFDWTGFVTQVTLDGRHTFCVPEAADGTGTGGQGLCNEFGIFRPLGYDDCAVGEEFPKLGVGLLTRTDAEPYRFSRTYPLRAFPLRSEASGESVAYTVEPLPCRGLAARLEKTLRVSGNRLVIAYRLDNVGTRRITTNEYGHNFVAIDGAPTGPATRLCLPFNPVVATAGTTVCAPLALAPGEVRWTQAPKQAFYQPLRGFADSAGCWWELRVAGVAVRERSTVPWAGFTVWGTERVISPEVFVEVDVAPGARLEWQREYEFLAD